MSPRPRRGPTVAMLLRFPPPVRHALRVRAAEAGLSIAVMAELILTGRAKPLRLRSHTRRQA